MTETLMQHLRRHEGVKYQAYQDQGGYWHIGMGTLIDGRIGGAVSDDVVEMMAREDILRNQQDLDKKCPWWRSLDPVRQMALEAMAYQLGVPRLLEFKKMLACLEMGDWLGAHTNALNSVWAEQTPARAKEVALLLRDGK